MLNIDISTSNRPMATKIEQRNLLTLDYSSSLKSRDFEIFSQQGLWSPT